MSVFNIIAPIIYIPNSKTNVAPIIISIIVILLSFEKLLLKYPDNKPSNAYIITDIPKISPINISKNTPITAPNIIDIFLPAKSPINTIRTMNKFGFIPSILNQVKKLDCKKYIIKNIINNITTVVIFFNIPPYLI